MKNVLKKGLLFFALAFLVFSIPSLTHAKQNDIPLEINQEKQHIKIPLTEPENETEGLPTAKATGNVGYVDVWVSNNGRTIYWDVVVNPPYKGNGFTGTLSVTNLNSGLSSGRNNINKMKGSLIAPPFNSKYGARLSGVLTYNGATTGVTVASPYLVWERK